jgi:hypothetical protein
VSKHLPLLILACVVVKQQDYADAGANMYTFHLEAVAGESLSQAPEVKAAMEQLCNDVRKHGMYVGLAIKPATPAEALLPYLEAGLADMVRRFAMQSMKCVWKHGQTQPLRCVYWLGCGFAGLGATGLPAAYCTSAFRVRYICQDTIICICGDE